MAIVFRSLILFLTVLQSFTFGRYPPLPPSLEKNSNGKSGISLPLTVCIVQVQNIYVRLKANTTGPPTTWRLISILKSQLREGKFQKLIYEDKRYFM